MHVPRMAYSILGILLASGLRLWGQQAELIKEFDKDGDGKLSTEERVSMIQAVSERSGAKERSENREEAPPTLAPGLGGPNGFGPGGISPALPEEPGSLTRQFDLDGDGKLDKDERTAARQELRANPRPVRGPRRRTHGTEPPPQAGMQILPEKVEHHGDKSLYDNSVLKTLFLEFDSDDWEAELSAFYRTDVEIPARLQLDEWTIPEVGVRYRGNTSTSMVAPGRKKSLNISINYSDSKQTLQGYKTLNLLNAHTDPTVMREILFSHVSKDYQPTLKAHHVRVVINGELWGIYVNSQQFDTLFLKEAFDTSKGTRWKKPADPKAGNGMAYLGDRPTDYSGFYELKTDLEDPLPAWNHYIRFAKALAEAPIETLDKTLESFLNVDGALWFLALENVLIDADGYWVRASDFNFYQDPRGRFHMIAHDNNETFRLPGGPGFRGNVRGVELDPLFGVEDSNKPLLRLLKNPNLRMRYLAHVRTITQEWLTWSKFEPLVEQYRKLIDQDIQRETRQPGGETFEQFLQGLTQSVRGEGPGGGAPGLKEFIEERGAYLRNHPETNLPTPEFETVQIAPVTVQPNPLGRLLLQTKLTATLTSSDDHLDQLVLYTKNEPLEPFKDQPMQSIGQGRFEAQLENLNPGQSVYYYLEARGKPNQSGSMFFPQTASFQPLSMTALPPSKPRGRGLSITRLMAINRTFKADPQGDYDDWIECANLGSTTVDLSNIFLSDDGQRPLKWAFPAGKTLAPGEKLMIWADEDGKAPSGLHANFKLSSRGESLFLSQRENGQIILMDHLEYKDAKPDQVIEPSTP